MALNWQDVAQVRFQDTTQAAKNISDSLGSLGDPLQAVIDSQTEDRQDALDSAIARQQAQATGMSAMASGMNAQASMLDIQRKTSPEYIEMENQKIQAQIQMYAAQKLDYENKARDSEFKHNMQKNMYSDLFTDSPKNVAPPVVIPSIDATTPINGVDTTDAIVTNEMFPAVVFNKYTPKNQTNQEKKDAFATTFGMPATFKTEYANLRDTDTVQVINDVVDKWKNASVKEQANIIKDFKSKISATSMAADAQLSYTKIFDDKITAARNNITKAKDATTLAQTEALQAQIYNWKVGEPVPTTASVVNSTNLTAKAVNSILQPVQEIEERDKFISKFSNDTNLAVQDENGLYRLTKAGIAEYNKDIKLLKNTRKHWNNPQIFENTLKSFLNVESSKNILSNEKKIAAEDTSEINIRHNTNQDTVYKYTTQTYTPSATWNKLGLDNLNPEKIETVVKRIQNDDTWFKNNEWVLYQAIQQIGGVDSDWLTRNELETVSNNSNWWTDQNEDVTLAALYKHAIRLRRAHTSGRTYRTKSGKEYTQPLIVMSPASKASQLKHEKATETSYLNAVNSVDTETGEFTIDRRGRKVKKKTTKK